MPAVGGDSPTPPDECHAFPRRLADAIRAPPAVTAHWLVKSEPDAFSWDQQVAVSVEPWTGVRNALAARNLREMRVGDLAFFYHSNEGREIVGIVEVAREAYPDPTEESGRWCCVDMRALRPVPRRVTLTAMKAEPRLEGLALIRQSRLSVVPVSAAHWAVLSEMAGL